MRLLLDTCIVYDWLMGVIASRPLIERIQTEGAFVSAASVWEMAIKYNLGKLALPSARIAEDIEAQGFQWLLIAPYHAQAILGLDNHHKDPFDRLLIAQARYEGLLLVTYDTVFEQYLDADAVLVI
jgi:PIN domain nuclease of toxin-antitoxin system